MGCTSLFRMSAIAMLLFVSVASWRCQIRQEPTAPEQRNPNGFSLAKPTKVESRQALRQHFAALARSLAERVPEVLPRMIGQRIEEVPIAALGFPADLARMFQMPDGRVIEVTLERAQPCDVDVTSIDDPVLFAADPDVFNSDEDGSVCQAFLAADGQVTEVSFDVEGYKVHYASVALYLVGYRETRSDPVLPAGPIVPAVPDTGDGGGGGGGGGCPPGGITPYAVVTDIRQKTDYDPWSKEEFTVYVSLSHDPSAYDYETELIFDGNTRTDAAGRSVLFPDINDTGRIYDLGSCGIAFLLLENGVDKGFIAIEQDTDPQDTHHSTKSPAPPYPGPTFKYQTVDVQYVTGGASWGVTRKFWFWWYSNRINSDDVITSGAYEKFSTAWNPDPGTVRHLALHDNDFWVIRHDF